MKKGIISITLLASVIIAGQASPLWLRKSAISPDGKTIAFCYKGNIFTVASSGGDARQITQGESYNSTPVWSPDGKQISFASDREGSADIFIVDSKGGAPRRLTTNSAAETPLAFLNDSTIMFSSRLFPSAKAAQGAFQSQVYTVGTNGNRPTMLYSWPMRTASVSPDGKILFQDIKGFENQFRKHERSSSTADIWLINEGKFSKLTDFNGHDLNPVWGSDGSYYFVSEEDGTLNIYHATVNGKEKKKLTNFTKHPVRSLSVSNNGILAFSYDGELYTMTEATEPRKVNVNIVMDEYASPRQKSAKRSGADDFAVSPDGKTVAFTLRGDVYITSVEYETTRRITDTPSQERCVTFAPDGRSIVYDSERDGMWQLFQAEIANPEENDMLYAAEIVEKPLYRSEKTAFQPIFSPDGTKVAFLEDRTELRVIDLKTKKVNTALDGKYNYSYSDGDVSFQWSPDSRWLLVDYIGVGGWNNSDIAVVSADGSKVIDLTESGYSDSVAKWVLGGKAVTWKTGKYGYKSHGSWGNETDVMIMFLDGEAWDRFCMNKEERELADKADEKAKKDKDNDKSSKKKKDKKEADKTDSADKEQEKVEPLEFDFDNRKYRMARLTPASAFTGDYFLNNDGDKFYYVANSPDGRSLYQRDILEDEVTVLSKDLSGWGITHDKKGENLFILTNSGIKKINLSSGKTTPVKFEAEYTRRPAQEREYIYHHAWQQVKDKFHDVNLHGTDWDFYGKEYAKFLPYINNNQDFAEMLSELLGELNASHTGASARTSAKALPTASLAVFFDESHTADGLKIAEVLKQSPMASKKVNARKGDIITMIDGVDIKAGHDFNELLEGKAGKKIKLGITRADGKSEVVFVKPVTSAKMSQMLYNRWIERNAAVVDSVSGGRIGYVHVRGMDSPSFRDVYDKLLGKYRNCEAVVVDTRYNGGGWLHNDIAILLNGQEYVRFTPRGHYIGSEPFSQWTKPSVMLVNESNYSDAHGTPFVYQSLKIGDVVGAPVPGTMTAVWWETQIDPSLVFGIPQVTSLDMNGQQLENKQLTPDVIIYNTPENVMKGIDDQLIGATKHLMKKLSK